MNYAGSGEKVYYAQKLSARRLERVYEIAGPEVRRYLQCEIDHLAAFVRPGDRILELGCGYGRVLVPLAAIAGKGWGLDNSFESLRLAATKHPTLHLALMDAGFLGFEDRCFDVVFGIQNFVSACKVEPRKLLKECLRVVRPGGRIFLSSYAERFWAHRLKWFKQQAAEGLLGPIDERATGRGMIVCKDGFKATTFSPEEFETLTKAFNMRARIQVVEDASVFCEIVTPEADTRV